MEFGKKNWDVSDITSQLRSLYNACTGIESDQQQSSDLKKDLYQIKFFVDYLIKETPEFDGEKDWLNNQEKKRLVKILKME
jgi:hypothetical protein